MIIGEGGVAVRGRVLLAAAGVILIISGVFGLLTGVLFGSIGTFGDLDSVMLSGTLGLAAGLIVISSLITIFFGILGIRYRERPDKTTTLIVIGVILIVMDGLSLIRETDNFASGAAGIVLGALYIVGAVLNDRY
jgi:hypothetical protein